MFKKLAKSFMVLTIVALSIGPIHALEADENDINTLVYNTDCSENFDLNYNNDVYTVNIRIKGNWDLTPDQATLYRDEGGNNFYSKYDASWDDKDFELTIDCGNAINASIDKVTYSHDQSKATLTAKIRIRFKKSTETNKKIWRYQTVTMEVEQLEIPVVETMDAKGR